MSVEMMPHDLDAQKKDQKPDQKSDVVGDTIHDVLKTGAGVPRKYITAVDVVKANDVDFEDVHVPEWGGWICMKGLTGKERDDFETSLRIKKNGKADVSTVNMRAKLVARCAVKSPADHSRIWADEDANALGNKSSKVISRLYDVASKLSGFTDADTEELEKNPSTGDPTGNSK